MGFIFYEKEEKSDYKVTVSCLDCLFLIVRKKDVGHSEFRASEEKSFSIIPCDMKYNT